MDTVICTSLLRGRDGETNVGLTTTIGRPPLCWPFIEKWVEHVHGDVVENQIRRCAKMGKHESE